MAEEKVQSIQDLFEADVSAHVIDKKIVKMGKTSMGDLFGEDVRPEGAKKANLIPMFIENEIDGKTVHIPLTRPPAEIDPDVYYPAKRFRVTQTRLDELDYAPVDSWKAFPLAENGSVVYNRGVPLTQYYFILLSIESLTETEECSFADIPAVQGSTILERQRAKETLGASYGGATRRRIEDDVDVVEV